MPTFDRLPPLDSSFLYVESPTAHMHVGSVAFLSDPGLSEEEITSHVESRLGLVPRYRQKIAWVPGNQGRPVWVDDTHFDIKNHVVFTGVPKPGTEREVLRLASRLLSRPLDRRRPLWEIWVVHTSNDRIALISKSHHCLVDGISAVDIGTAIMDLTADAPAVAGEPFTPRPEPSRAELLTDALVERMTQPREIFRSVRAATRTPRAIAKKGLEVAQGLLSQAQEGMSVAPKVSFTRQIGPHRRFDIVRMSLKDIKAIKNHFGCTVNDIVLAIVTGALRRLLHSRGEPTEGLSLRAMVPVSFRSDSERNTYGNKVSWVMADLPLALDDPRERVAFLHRSMKHLKESRQAVGAEFWFKLSEYAPPTVLALAGRAAAFQRMCNLVVTNIPGPQFPLFFRGGQMLDAFPVVPIMGTTSLGVAILSYDGQLNFGINADWDLFPDLGVLVAGLTEARDELLQLASPPPVA
jgi:diacylglycerol O-acyltransferase